MRHSFRATSAFVCLGLLGPVAACADTDAPPPPWLDPLPALTGDTVLLITGSAEARSTSVVKCGRRQLLDLTRSRSPSGPAG